jgi:ATP-dependent exoDNAse (exonuclease V) alpha subunit
LAKAGQGGGSVAIYHFSAKVIQRAAGRSAVAAAAYRAGARLFDDRLGRTFNYSSKPGVIHSEILLPEGGPARWLDRVTLWNEVEAFERRKDAQLAREVELALPCELPPAEAIQLAQDFVRAQFVARGMVADLNIHWGTGPDGAAQPHAHVMLSLREQLAIGHLRR